MNQLSLTATFKTIARQHKKIKHTIGGRKSFFRMNRDAEIINSSGVNVSFPVLLIQDINGRLLLAGTVNDEFYIEFEVRDKVSINGDFDAIDAARDLCKEIGHDIIAWIDRECEENGSCGPIGTFDIGTVSWEYTGPVNDMQYGCRYRFSFRKTAYDQFRIDLNEKFASEFFIPLLDSDGLPLMDFDNEILNDLE